MIRSLIDFLLVAALALGASACAGSGGGSPIDPSGGGGSTGPGGAGAVISGTVIGRQLSGQSAAATLDGPSALTVTVNGTSLTATVSASGHFEISDVPPGNVELVFSDGSSSWIVVLMDVAAGQQIQIQINLSSGIPTIVSQSRSTSSAAGTGKVRLCHKTESGRYQPIEISVSAEATHRAHGDAAIGEAVPAEPTKVFDANCQPVGPSIRIVKSTNGEDADEAPGPSIKVGSAVTWTYEVTNTGTVLLNVAVTDNQSVAVSCPVAMLGAGASMTCTGTGLAVLGQYSNIGTATGTDPITNVTVSHSDPSHYFGEADDPGGPLGPKVSLCHKKGKGRYQLITVGAPAEPAHRAHGDAKPGEQVPNENGKTFAADCTF